jgi:hypothetical protein
VGGAFNLAAGEDARRVSINQQTEQYGRMMGPRTAPRIISVVTATLSKCCQTSTCATASVYI